MVYDNLTFIWIVRTTDTVEEVLPLFERLWMKLEYALGLDLAQDAFKLKIYCNDKNRNTMSVSSRCNQNESSAPPKIFSVYSRGSSLRVYSLTSFIKSVSECMSCQATRSFPRTSQGIFIFDLLSSRGRFYKLPTTVVIIPP